MWTVVCRNNIRQKEMKRIQLPRRNFTILKQMSVGGNKLRDRILRKSLLYWEFAGGSEKMLTIEY